MEYGCCQRSAANLRKEKIMKKIILALVMCLAVGVAHAESYVKVGIGSGNVDNKTVSTFGVGYSYNSWLSVEADYRNLGGSTEQTGYVLDPNAATTTVVTDATTDPVTTMTYRNCEPNCTDKKSYGTTKARGVGLSALLKYDMVNPGETSSFSQTLFLRVGALYSKSKYTTSFTPTNPLAGGFNPNAIEQATYANRVTPLLGVGIEIGRVALELTQYGGVYLVNGQMQSTSTASLTYRQPL
jgi:hypothetical protein